MRFYAERPQRLARQIVVDLAVLAWVIAWAWVAVQTRAQVLRLQAPGERLVEAGNGVRGAFDGAADSARRVPLVGDDLAGALGGGSGAGRSIADAGRAQIEAVAALASGLAIGIAALALVPVLLGWLPLRLRYARAAAAGAAMRASDPDLLALRALVGLPARRLLRVCDDPAAAWRAGDPAVVDRLAELQLAELGLRGRR